MWMTKRQRRRRRRESVIIGRRKKNDKKRKEKEWWRKKRRKTHEEVKRRRREREEKRMSRLKKETPSQKRRQAPLSQPLATASGHATQTQAVFSEKQKQVPSSNFPPRAAESVGDMWAAVRFFLGKLMSALAPWQYIHYQRLKLKRWMWGKKTWELQSENEVAI